MKVCSKWVRLEVSWVEFECFYTLVGRCRCLLGWFCFPPLPTFLTVFLAHFWAIQGPFWDQNEVIFGMNLTLNWHHFSIILCSFWCHFDHFLVILLALFAGLWAFLEHFFWRITAHFCYRLLRSFTIFWVVFWEIQSKMMQNDAREDNNMQISAKKSPTLCKMVQNACHFSPMKHLFCLKKTVKIDVATYESVQ